MKEFLMQQKFKTLPDIPEGFAEERFSELEPAKIYYKRNKNYSECICGECGKRFVFGNMKRTMTKEDYIVPVRGEKAKCPLCGNEGRWEWKKTTRTFYTVRNALLLQRTRDGNLVARIFTINREFDQCGSRKGCRESKRIFYSLGSVVAYYNVPKYINGKWQRAWGTRSNGESHSSDFLVEGWEEELEKSNLKYAIDLLKTEKGNLDIYSWEDKMEAYANNPAIEMFLKSGMVKLVGFLINHRGKSQYVNRKAKNPLKQLRLEDKGMLNRLIEAEGAVPMLKVLQLETKTKRRCTLEEEEYMMSVFKDFGAWDKEIKDILKYMSIRKFINMIEKYKNQRENPAAFCGKREVIRKYHDYLKMREELGYDMNNEVFIFPKNLEEKHSQMVEEKNKKNDECYIEKMEKKYNKISARYKALDRKYHFHKSGLEIRPAATAAEIVMEGRRQHHCVGREFYLEKHNDGRSFILLLRREEAPEKPYYTIEIKDEEIVQWYGAYDKKPEEETIGNWLKEYADHLAAEKRLRA